MVREEARNGIRLEGWHCENVAEAASAEDYLLTSAFRVIYSIPRINLCGTDSRDKRACNRETRVEASTTRTFLACSLSVVVRKWVLNAHLECLCNRPRSQPHHHLLNKDKQRRKTLTTNVSKKKLTPRTIQDSQTQHSQFAIFIALTYGIGCGHFYLVWPVGNGNNLRHTLIINVSPMNVISFFARTFGGARMPQDSAPSFQLSASFIKWKKDKRKPLKPPLAVSGYIPSNSGLSPPSKKRQ